MLRPEVSTARRLRREMQLPEVLLWQALRGAKTGIKFRRQHPVGPYVVDFFAREPLLIIEVDGEAHERGNRPERDELRDRFLNENGYRVMRVRAVDVLRDLGAVVSSIISLAERPLHHASHGPPPRSGEE
ncbi:DUF559 domain-containing protein [Sphingomonas sp. 3F27E9-B]|uniref:DUF559 domain-containing protein n=2 Tax=Sphingomonas TaxID=13687 RepID=UPI000A45367C